MKLLPCLLLAATVAPIAVAPAVAQTFPTRPVRLISPYPPGGGNDIVSRIVAEKLGPLLGQNVIVENRAGAGGNVGTEVAARAPADGHTLVMGSLSHPINATLYRRLPFDPIKDFATVTVLAAGAYVLVSHPSLPVKNVRELVALAKARPGQINYGSAGNGAGGHLGMEMFKNMAGIDLVHVPYKGTAPAMAETVAGQVSLDMDNMLALLPQVKAGRLRPLAVTTLKRSSLLPEVPTMEESGFKGFEVSPWFGVLAPAGTPKDVIARLHGEMVKVLRMPDVRERLLQQGAEPVGNTPEQFGAYLRAEVEKWAKVVKATGARID